MERKQRKPRQVTASLLLMLLLFHAPASPGVYFVEKSKLQYTADFKTVCALLTNEKLPEEVESSVKEILTYGYEGDRGAVGELITLLNTAPQECIRIAAAFSLLHIGDHRGIDAVVNASQYDQSMNVQHVCKDLYKQRIRSMS